MAKRLEPKNYFDVLFIVEHPAFAEFYDNLLADGVVAEIGDDADKTKATGDLESVNLRACYDAYDFAIPIIIRDADEELRQPSIDPMMLRKSKFQLDWLIKHVGKGDRFVSEDQQTGDTVRGLPR